MSHTILDDLKRGREALIQILRGVGGVWSKQESATTTLKDIAIDIDAIQRQLGRLVGVNTSIKERVSPPRSPYRSPRRSPSPPKKPTKRHRIILRQEEEDDEEEEEGIVRRGRSPSPSNRYKRERSQSPSPVQRKKIRDVEKKVPTEEERKRREEEEGLSVYLRYIPRQYENEEGEIDFVPQEPFLTKEAQEKEEKRLCKEVFSQYGRTRRGFVWCYSDKKSKGPVPVARILFHDATSRQNALEKKDEIAEKYLLQVSTTKYE